MGTLKPHSNGPSYTVSDWYTGHWWVCWYSDEGLGGLRYVYRLQRLRSYGFTALYKSDYYYYYYYSYYLVWHYKYLCILKRKRHDCVAGTYSLPVCRCPLEICVNRNCQIVIHTQAPGGPWGHVPQCPIAGDVIANAIKNPCILRIDCS